MNEIFYSTDGLRRITRLAPMFRLRLVIFTLALIVGVLLFLWMQASVGRQVAQVQRELGAIRAEGFYVGVHMRSHVRQLNEMLLSLHLKGASADQGSFLTEAHGLKEWIGGRETILTTTNEQVLFHRMQAAYDRYLAEVEPLLKVQDMETALASFPNTYVKLLQSSRPVLDSVNLLVQAQQVAFDGFIRDSQQTLAGLQRLLNLSLMLLLAAGVALALLVYRGLFAPLHRRLTESHALLQRHEKLAALGTLAAGVAHEIRNPLTAIKFRLFSLHKALPPEFSENEDAIIISSEINRLDRIVKDFLQFARPSEPEPIRVPADRILQEVHDLLQPQLEKSGIRLKLDTRDSAWVRADTQQIKQAMINLIQNAADSIERNGSISLRLSQEVAMLGGKVRPAVVLQVTDTGKGIPPEVQKRLFDPFFSTKDGGTGLGLAIAARIVEKHEGLLRYQTEKNRGATFEILLPRAEDHAVENPHY